MTSLNSLSNVCGDSNWVDAAHRQVMTPLTRTAPLTSVGNLTQDNIGDTIEFVQVNRPSLRDHLSGGARPPREEVRGVISSVVHASGSTLVGVGGVKYAIRHTTGVAIERAPQKTAVSYPPLPPAQVRPITAPSSAAEAVQSDAGYVSAVLPTETGLPSGTRIDTFAYAIDSSDLGHVVAFTIGQISTSGTLEEVTPGPFEDAVRLTVDGQDFVMPSGKPVSVVVAHRRAERPRYFTVR